MACSWHIRHLFETLSYLLIILTALCSATKAFEPPSLDCGSAELVDDRQGHSVHSLDTSEHPILTVSKWQPIEPSSEAMAGMLAVLTCLRSYPLNLNEDSFVSGSRLSLRYGGITITITVTHGLNKRDMRIYRHPSTTKDILLANLEDMLKAVIASFFGFGEFVWKYGGFVWIGIAVAILHGNHEMLKERAFIFGPIPNPYRPRYLVF